MTTKKAGKPGISGTKLSKKAAKSLLLSMRGGFLSIPKLKKNEKEKDKKKTK